MASPGGSAAPNTPPGTPSPIARLTALFPKAPNGGPKLITEPAEFNETMERLANCGLCNLLCSIQYVDYIPPVQAVSLRVIASRPEMWYSPSWCKDGAAALKGESLAALFREAGGSYRKSERLDDGSDRNYVHIQATVVVRAMSGLDAAFHKDREIDLRPGAPELEAMRDRKTGQPQTDRISQARQTILRVCETKAQLRAIRAAIGAKQSYLRDETKLPFVIPTLVPNPDMSNPLHANFMLAHSMGAVEAIYGRGPRQLPPSTTETPVGVVDLETGEVFDVEPEDERASSRPTGDDASLANAAAGGAADSTYGEIPTEPTTRKCECPCGCAVQVSPAAVAMTLDRGGSVRCAECWPGGRFVYERHRHLGSLGLTPDISPKKAAEIVGGGK